MTASVATCGECGCTLTERWCEAKFCPAYNFVLPDVERFDRLPDGQRDAHLHLTRGDIIQHPSGQGRLYVVTQAEPRDVRAETWDGKDKVTVINIVNWMRVKRAGAPR